MLSWRCRNVDVLDLPMSYRDRHMSNVLSHVVDRHVSWYQSYRYFISKIKAFQKYFEKCFKSKVIAVSSWNS